MATKRKARATPKPIHSFTCLYCNAPFDFPYTTGPKPVFCSRSCQAKFRYRREKAIAAGIEPVLPDDWPRGKLAPGVEVFLDLEPLTCSRCGRPLAQGESLGPWRLRVSSASTRIAPQFWPICPAHYGEAPVFDEEWDPKRD